MSPNSWRRPLSPSERGFIYLTATFLGIGVLAVLLGLLIAPAADSVDRASYAAGWASAVSRQVNRPGAVSPWLRDDATVLGICLASSEDGRAEQEGAVDRDDYRAGCHDAVRMTSLEPSPEEIDRYLDRFSLPNETMCFEVPPR